MKKMFLAAAAATAFVSTAAWATVTFDPTTGTGFVGKGDVQLVYLWNNKQLQDNGSKVKFRANSLTVTEVSWECTNLHNDNVQERSRTTTTSVEGIVSSIARDNSKGKDGSITGFHLNGYSGGSTVTSTTTDGPRLNSCPASPSTWSLSTPAGDPEVVESSSALEVSGNNGLSYEPLN